ncbi:hypothetical protein HanIR_Chr05g0220851 [Helianthus annuus]|nr:hypothetical protein HanIR_Chr05g0220851 [Helianthus annuus]
MMPKSAMAAIAAAIWIAPPKYRSDLHTPTLLKKSISSSPPQNNIAPAKAPD